MSVVLVGATWVVTRDKYRAILPACGCERLLACVKIPCVDSCSRSRDELCHKWHEARVRAFADAVERVSKVRRRQPRFPGQRRLVTPPRAWLDQIPNVTVPDGFRELIREDVSA